MRWWIARAYATGCVGLYDADLRQTMRKMASERRRFGCRRNYVMLERQRIDMT